MVNLLQMIPVKARKVVYAVLTAVLAVYGIWQATEGNWEQFIVSTITSLSTGMATANTNVKVESE